MPIKNIFTAISIISIFAIALFIYPSTNQSVIADQLNSGLYKYSNISFQETKHIINNSQRIAATDAVIAEYFGKDVVDKILAQPGCAGVRMYYGKQSSGRSGVLIIGYDRTGKDMVSGVLALPHLSCPPFCTD